MKLGSKWMKKESTDLNLFLTSLMHGKNVKLLSTSHTRVGMSKTDATLRYKGVTNVNKHTDTVRW